MGLKKAIPGNQERLRICLPVQVRPSPPSSPPFPRRCTHGKGPVRAQTSGGKSDYILLYLKHWFIFPSFRSYGRQKKTRPHGGKEHNPVLDHLLSIIQLPPNKDATFLSHSWATLVVLPHVRWENTLCIMFKGTLSMLSKTLISHSLLFHEKPVWTFPFPPHFLDRPLEKEKVVPLVTCFIESLFMAVDRGRFGKGQ